MTSEYSQRDLAHQHYLPPKPFVRMSGMTWHLHPVTMVRASAANLQVAIFNILGSKNKDDEYSFTSCRTWHRVAAVGTKAKKLSEDALAVTVSTPMARASAEESAGGLETLLGGSSAVGVCRLCWRPSQRGVRQLRPAVLNNLRQTSQHFTPWNR